MTQKEIIREICKAEGITIDSMSQDYVFKLTHGDITRHIFGAFWGLNNAAADRIATDKCACYSMMQKNGVPAIRHELMNNPLLRQGWLGALNTPQSGVWSKTLELFNAFNKKVVVKPNQGSMGLDVFLCDTIPKMEAAIQSIFTTQPNAAISPYVEITTEYRVFFINGECPLAYGKTPNKEKSWQHNLAQGAIATPIPPEKQELLQNLSSIAINAAQAIGITFATVDIAQDTTGKLQVMEINSGVQAKFLLEQHPQLIDTIRNIYTKAIRLMFE